MDGDTPRTRRRRLAADEDLLSRIRRKTRMSTRAKIALVGGSIGAVTVLILVVLLIIAWNGPRDVRTAPFQVRDELTASDSFDSVRHGSRCKTYWVHLEGGRTYAMTMVNLTPGGPPTPWSFDPFLRLENRWGSQLAEDDDSGGGPNVQDALIVFRAPHTGDYRLITTTFNNGSTGRYLLSVKQRL
jgi:hypothetical protein